LSTKTPNIGLTKPDLSPTQPDIWGATANTNYDIIDTLSGTLSDEIDSDIATHAATAGAHHIRTTRD